MRVAALCEADVNNNVNETLGSAPVAQRVATAVNGMAYSLMSYLTSEVRAVPLSASDGEPFAEPSAETAFAVPIRRGDSCGSTSTGSPKPLPPLEWELIKMALAKIGLQVVLKGAYILLSASVAWEEPRRIGYRSRASRNHIHESVGTVSHWQTSDQMARPWRRRPRRRCNPRRA